MTIFDPNAAATPNSGIFGLYDTPERAKLVYIPVPWERTASYGKGTARGPEAIFRASKQIDLFHPELGRIYEAGFAMLPISEKLLVANTCKDADVNRWSEEVNQYVYTHARRIYESGQWVGVIGGDHSSPFGALQACAESRGPFGILHLDAHADTRDAYEGYVWSHASIMRNVLTRIPKVSKLVQVGIRDFCEEEQTFLQEQGDRMAVFTDFERMRAGYAGKTWHEQTQAILEHLPEQVWVSFDIDALDPRYCPNTGTPVPGGLDFYEAYYLISEVVRSGRRLIGFDLCEVGNSEWDGNVGARMLYHLSGWLMKCC